MIPDETQAPTTETLDPVHRELYEWAAKHPGLSDWLAKFMGCMLTPPALLELKAIIGEPS
jgi:hypothetical protein